MKNIDGSVTLSSFVTAQPNGYLDCQPILKFYVAVGTYTAGTVMNFTQSSQNAAVCDATSGYTTFQVIYDSAGGWQTTPFVPNRVRGGALRRAPANAEIKNEAGTALISTGHAANFRSPVTVENLSYPDAVLPYSEYRVGPIGGPDIGYMCIDRQGHTAKFA